MQSIRFWVWALCGLSGVAWAAHEGHDMGGHAAQGCGGQVVTNIHCGQAPSAQFGRDGRLWVSWADGGHVYVSHSDDHGRSYSEAVSVNRHPEQVEAGGESRPKLALGTRGEVYVSYTQRLAGRYTGNIRFSRSLDGGEHFSDPITINDNREAIGHRFDTLMVSQDGRVHLAWIDKRDQAAARKQGKGYTGAAIYYAVSSDRGEHFSTNRKLADHSCECCRIALAEEAGQVVAVWRHVFGSNIRDHVLAHIGAGVTVERISEDQWDVDACPHHGPALLVDDKGTTHVAWYTLGKNRQGLFYAARPRGARAFSAPMALGLSSEAAGHAALAAVGDEVYIAWRVFDGQQHAIRLLRSSDGGLHWGEPTMVATSAGEADYPYLLTHDRVVTLMWQSRAEGLRLIGVGQ